MNGQPYGAEGVTETEVEALVLTAGAFSRLMDASSAFRRFVFSAHATRVSDLLLLIEEVAFGRIEPRLARFLLAHARDGQWEGTHQDMATELGTAREVVSRQLKDFERRGLVTLGRGRVALHDRAALETLTA
jgi:CRP/FNR family transcriptional regulator